MSTRNLSVHTWLTHQANRWPLKSWYQTIWHDGIRWRQTLFLEGTSRVIIYVPQIGPRHGHVPNTSNLNTTRDLNWRPKATTLCQTDRGPNKEKAQQRCQSGPQAKHTEAPNNFWPPAECQSIVRDQQTQTVAWQFVSVKNKVETTLNHSTNRPLYAENWPFTF